MKIAIRVAVLFTAAMSLAACQEAANDEGDTRPQEQAAAADVEDTIEAREENFEDIAKASKKIKSALEGDPADLATVAAQADEINAKAKRIAALFPVGSGPESGEKTEALPAIWAKPAEFSAAGDKLVVASATLAAAAKSGDAAATKEAAAAVGGACKGCHDNFRKKKT